MSRQLLPLSYGAHPTRQPVPSEDMPGNAATSVVFPAACVDSPSHDNSGLSYGSCLFLVRERPVRSPTPGDQTGSAYEPSARGASFSWFAPWTPCLRPGLVFGTRALRASGASFSWFAPGTSCLRPGLVWPVLGTGLVHDDRWRTPMSITGFVSHPDIARRALTRCDGATDLRPAPHAPAQACQGRLVVTAMVAKPMVPISHQPPTRPQRPHESEECSRMVDCRRGCSVVLHLATAGRSDVSIFP